MSQWHKSILIGVLANVTQRHLEDHANILSHLQETVENIYPLLRFQLLFEIPSPQPTFTFQNLIKLVIVAMSMTLIWYLYCELGTHFTHCSGVSITDFEQVNTSGTVFTLKHLHVQSQQ